jgi:uncharacterized protein
VSVFLDTGFFLARIIRGDQWHRKAVAAYKPGLKFVTSSLVVSETVAFLQARGFFSAALEFLRELRANDRVQIVYVDAAVQVEAWSLFSRWGASGANPVDCASFAIMKQFSIKKAFTFDQHFQTAGFEILR